MRFNTGGSFPGCVSGRTCLLRSLFFIDLMEVVFFNLDFLLLKMIHDLRIEHGAGAKILVAILQKTVDSVNHQEIASLFLSQLN